MKAIRLLLTLMGLIVPALGQAADPTAATATLAALKALLPLKEQARFGEFLKDNRERSKFAEFWARQGRFALLANKEELIRVRAEADRPNYGGNAGARSHSNFWQAIIEGRATPTSTSQPPQNH